MTSGVGVPTSEFRGLNGPLTDNEDEDYPPQFTSLVTEQEKSKWSHIDDLDQFFTRVYQYHQNHGLPSLLLTELLNLFQIFFLTTFSLFIFECVDYKSLFQDLKVDKDAKNASFVKKKTLNDVVFPLKQCAARISFAMWIVIIIVMVFWAFRLVKAIYNIARYIEIRSFYISALNIQTKDLVNITWHEVQVKLLQMQKKHHMCIHKQELTELDIYNRILRFKNYEVAMVNQGLLPPKIPVPFIGQIICLTTGFKYNFEFLFFWGPFAPFTNCYQLRPEYKIFSKRDDLTAEISKSILIFGLINLFLSPAIFIWQLLQFVYNYTELIKRDPSILGVRRWSNYGKLYLRHFNELEHELEARLSRAYKPATLYLSSFMSRFVTVLAKFVVLTFGSIFAVLIILTIYDEDVLNVEHLLTIITVSGAIAGVARSMIPDESSVFYMDQMMYQILAQVHYMPDSWKTQANSYLVRDEFVKLFQYKFVYLLEELFSPIITPLIFLFWLRPRSSKIVDFLRNFTVDLVGVGDVCSFSQMDTHRHGNPRWFSKPEKTRRNFQANNGKTELSLIHFAHTNPQWKMPIESRAFMDQLREQAVRDVGINESVMEASQLRPSTFMVESATAHVPDIAVTSKTQRSQADMAASGLNNSANGINSLTKSLYHLQSLVCNSTLPSNLLKSNVYSGMQQQGSTFDQQIQTQQSFGSQPRGAVSRIEGPLFTNKQERQTLLTIAQSSTLQLSQHQLLPTPTVTTAIENSLDMCFSALYMHELHRKYHHGEYIDLDNVREEAEDGIRMEDNLRASYINPNSDHADRYQKNDDDYSNQLNDDSDSDNRLLLQHDNSSPKSILEMRNY